MAEAPEPRYWHDFCRDFLPGILVEVCKATEAESSIVVGDVVMRAEAAARMDREARAILAAPSYEESYEIPAPPLTAAEARRYIRRHLEQAGRSDTLFSDDAVRVIHAQARGPAQRDQPARHHRAAGRLLSRQGHRRRILRPNRHR